MRCMGLKWYGAGHDACDEREDCLRYTEKHEKEMEMMYGTAEQECSQKMVQEKERA